MIEQIRKEMEAQSVSIYRMAKDLDLDYAYMHRVINGKIDVSTSRIQEIAKYLKKDWKLFAYVK